MSMLYKTHYIIIFERDGKYFLRHDSGEIASRMLELEVSKEDAYKAMENEDAAYQVIIRNEDIAGH
jgi:hypothetical protein